MIFFVATIELYQITIKSLKKYRSTILINLIEISSEDSKKSTVTYFKLMKRTTFIY